VLDGCDALLLRGGRARSHSALGLGLGQQNGGGGSGGGRFSHEQAAALIRLIEEFASSEYFKASVLAVVACRVSVHLVPVSFVQSTPAGSFW
jgi:hypothetical protein